MRLYKRWEKQRGKVGVVKLMAEKSEGIAKEGEESEDIGCIVEEGASK